MCRLLYEKRSWDSWVIRAQECKPFIVVIRSSEGNPLRSTWQATELHQVFLSDLHNNESELGSDSEVLVAGVTVTDFCRYLSCNRSTALYVMIALYQTARCYFPTALRRGF